MNFENVNLNSNRDLKSFIAYCLATELSMTEVELSLLKIRDIDFKGKQLAFFPAQKPVKQKLSTSLCFLFKCYFDNLSTDAKFRLKSSDYYFDIKDDLNNIIQTIREKNLPKVLSAASIIIAKKGVFYTNNALIPHKQTFTRITL